MKRYFDLPDAKCTLELEVEAGSSAALAEAEVIRDYFGHKGAIREVESVEYRTITRQYAHKNKRPV